MAFYTELKGPALEAYHRMKEVLIDKAMKELNLPRSMLIIRQLRSPDMTGSDISATDEQFRYGFNGGNSAFSTITNSTNTIADNRFIGINAVFNNEAITDALQVRIDREGTTTRFWQTKPIRHYRNIMGWVDDPVTVDQNTVLTVQAYSQTATTTTDFGFMGVVVEKKGLLVASGEGNF